MKGQTEWVSIIGMDDAFFWASLHARRALSTVRRSGVTHYAVAWDSTATPRRAR